jgi:hypothetical protein
MDRPATHKKPGGFPPGFNFNGRSFDARFPAADRYFAAVLFMALSNGL